MMSIKDAAERLLEGLSLPTKTDNKNGKNVAATSGTATMVARTINEAIDLLWNAKQKKLAELAGISESKVSQLKTHGADDLTQPLKAVCGVLKIDPQAVLQGKIVQIETPNDLVSLAKSLAGTRHEEAALAMLKHLAEIEDHSVRH